jgi:hypothetical protein
MGSGMLSGMASSTPDKVRENRLRRMAERQGLTLRKSRRRDPRALEYGLFDLVEATERADGTYRGRPMLTLDEVEAQLTGKAE